MAWEMTPQGYIKTTAKITKGGVLQYYGHELGLTDNRANKLVDVNRSLEELSKPDTLKSIDGMPLTITHPDKKSVTAQDWKDKTVGHVQNPRPEGNYIVCDVYVQDAAAIELLKDKDIRELSVGYEPADIQEQGGRFYHKNIRVNHIAIVAEGRAGSDCRLNDNKGKPLMKVKAKITDVLSLLKGKKLNDSDEITLTADEITKMIEALESQLSELSGNDDEESQAKIAELQKQIDDLKAKLPTPTDEDTGDEKDARIVELTAELEQTKAERDDLQKRVDELEAKEEKSNAVNDAKARFPKVNLADAKTAKDVLSKVLIDNGIYTKEQTEKLTDTEIRAAYAGLSALQKKTNRVATSLLNDNKQPQGKSASARMGGK